VRYRLVPHMLETTPGKKSFIETVKDDALERFKAFNKTAFARAVVANENSEWGELDHATITHSLEMAESDALQRELRLQSALDLLHCVGFGRFRGTHSMPPLALGLATPGRPG